jgi:chromosomal replication initiation ATPase DnaA
MTDDRSSPRQLPLALALPARLGAEDYVVGDANRAAHALVARWPDWPSRNLLLVGPRGAGKTHLVAIWAERSGARVLPAAGLPSVDPAALAAAGPVAVEDLGPGLAETPLFHLINAAAAAGHGLILTARTPPVAWGLAVPDLVSRLRAATPADLAEPDDALLEAVLAKLFADRQVAVDPQVLRYAASRMERSYAAAADLVAAADRAALAAKAPVNRAIVARILAGRPGREPELPGLDGDGGSGNNLS